MTHPASPLNLHAYVDGVGFLAPGLTDWPTACAILRGEAAYEAAPTVLPSPQSLPSAERRRASRVVKLALALGQEAATHAQTDVATLATVFSASGADGHNCHALCEQLASDDRQISPTRFHNSVHNAAAGYWTIAAKSMAPCQVLSAFDGSFAAGLFDALGQVMVDDQITLLVAYDSEYPEPLRSMRPIPDCAGVGLVLSPQRSSQSLGRVSCQLVTDAGAMALDHLPMAELEALRADVPSMRSLPLLQLMARGEAGEVCLDYLGGSMLKVRYQPC